jgi:hypothetical protein
MHDIRKGAAAGGDKEADEWVESQLGLLETGRETMRDICKRAARAALEAADPEIQQMKSKEEKLDDEKAMKWSKSRMSGLARVWDYKHDAAVKKATARVRELHSQGLLHLASNGTTEDSIFKK